MSGWLNQHYEPKNPNYNPFESGLAENKEKERKSLEEKEAKERAVVEAEEARIRAIAEADSAVLPKPSVPSDEQFAQMLGECLDKDAKLALIKGRASALFKEGFLEMAAAAYTSAINLTTPASHTLLSNRSACRCGFGNYEGALSDAEQCVKLMPAWPKGYVRMGAALHGLFRLDEAVRAYEAGLKHDPELPALKDGLADALKRRQAAGGEWTVAIEGARLMTTETRKGPTPLPQLGHCPRKDNEGPGHLLLGPAPYRHVVVIDGIHVKLMNCNDNYGFATREFNTQYKDAGTKTFENLPVAACCDPKGRDPALYTAETGNRGTLLRLKIQDSRAIGTKKEDPDKKMEECNSSRRELGIDGPRGMAFVDTSRMAGGGADSTLYVCDSGNGRVVALDPKELDERFTVGRPGSGDGELNMPVSVAAHGDILAIADSGNHRVCIFTLRGTFLRAIGEKPSKFSKATRPGQFVKPPGHVALADGHLFVLEAGGASRVHVLNPESGEPLGMLHPPFNHVPESADVVQAKLQRRRALRADGLDVDAEDTSDAGVDGGQGCLMGLCVSDEGLYVSTAHGKAPKILCLARKQAPEPAKYDHTAPTQQTLADAAKAVRIS